ncbi:hypothetical protein [Streptomyces bacillaris]|uniref:hypothetical protein n=1 Tax=Streptomyces bacillaris TaxID=68179 RepID=UPI0036F5B7AA
MVGQQPAGATHPAPYGSSAGFPPPPGSAPGGAPGGAPKKKPALIAAAAALAVVVIGGGIWLAVGGSDKESDDAKSPAAVGTPSATGPGGSAGESPTASAPAKEPSASPSARPDTTDNPYAPLPDGSGVQGGWLNDTRGQIVLGLSGAHRDEPERDNAFYSDVADELYCTGRWQETERDDMWKITLQCKSGGVRDESKDRAGTMLRDAHGLTVNWTKGTPVGQPKAEGFERLPMKMPPP